MSTEQNGAAKLNGIRVGDFLNVDQVDDAEPVIGFVLDRSEDDGFLFRKLDGELTWLSYWAMRTSSWRRMERKPA